MRALRRGKHRLGLGLGIVVLASLLGLWWRSRGREDLPNVLVVTCDTLRLDRTSLYGHTRPTTPNLESLAAESVVFESFFASSSFTPPSHASLLTGRHVATHGLLWWDQKVSPSVRNLAQILGTPRATNGDPGAGGGDAPRGLGYRTGAFVNLPNFEPMGVTRGFEKVRTGAWFPGGELNRDFFAWLDEPDERRFCAWLHYWDPHRPFGYREWKWLAPKELLRPVQRNALSPAERAHYDLTLEASQRPPLSFEEERFGKHDPRIGRAEEHYNRAGELQRTTPLWIPPADEHRPFTEEDDRYLVDRYDGGVLYLDRWIGELVEGLRSRGHLDRTILVITSDHGETFTERADRWFTHDPHLYEEVTHVPCLVRFPGGRWGGVRVEALASHVDVLPTILDWLGRRETGVQGASLLPRIEGRGRESWPPYAFSQTQVRKGFLLDPTKPKSEENPETWKTLDRKFSIRSATHRLIYAPEPFSVELYDLAADPGETRNLHAKDPSEVERKLFAALLDWIRTTPVAKEGDDPLSDAELEILRRNGYVDDR